MRCRPLARLAAVAVVVLLALGLLSAGVQATTLRDMEFKCALCGEQFTDVVVMSTNVMRRDTELRPYAVGHQPMGHYIHTCPRCGFTHHDHGLQLSEEQKAASRKFLSSYCQQHDCRKLTPSQKYEVVANLYQVLGQSSEAVAVNFHRAAWMADDEKNEEAARRFRAETIRFLQKALENKELPEDAVDTVTYVLGELNRRLGRFDEALKWFSRVKTQDPHLTALVKQQQELAQKKDSGKTMMPDLRDKGKPGRPKQK